MLFFVKNYLTPNELKLVTDPNIIFTKTKIIQSVYELFGNLSNEYQMQINFCNNKILEGENPKISKGENYKGLPYVMLDYPRNFSKEGVFAIRTFFWWGNFFSITVHLSGMYQLLLGNTLMEAIQNEKFPCWYINVSDNEWEHHFEPTNYRIIDPTNPIKIHSKTCIKLAKKIPLEKWEDVYDFLLFNFKSIKQAIYV